MNTESGARKLGLLLDYGGVLTTSVAESFAAFCATEGVDLAVFKRVVLDALGDRGSAFARVEIGALSDEDFDREVADLLGEACGRQIAHAGLKQRLFAGTQADPRMTEVVRKARAGGVKTALVSNSWGLSTYPREVLAGLFDAILLSGEIGLRKPEPDIYLAAAEQIGLPPQRCIFVDDLRLNVAGAEAVGMAGIHHRDVEQTVVELEDLLELPLR